MPTVLSQFESSKNVFIAKVVSIEKANDKTPRLYGVSGAKMIVQKVYKGNYKVGEEMFFAQGGGADCIWTYDEKSVGAEILIYTAYFDGKSKVGIIFGCSRTSGVQEAGEDLLYLDNLATTKGRSRISGTIDYWPKRALEGVEPPQKSVEGQIIKITNAETNKEYQVKTDKNGVYEIYDLPAGKYYLDAQIAKGWKMSKYLSDILVDYKELKKLVNKVGEIPEDLENEKNIDNQKPLAIHLFPNRHAGIGFTFEIDNAVRGKVFDPNGKPMKNVSVKAVPIGGKKEYYFNESGSTDENGEFTIDELPVGKYILAVNEDNKISADEPFGTFYYPAELEPDKAKIFSISEGEYINGVEIRVPKVEETITVEGHFLYSDGKPVINEGVHFKAAKKAENVESDSYTRTDSDGHFTLKILKGLEGEVYGEMFTYIGEFENCSSIEKIIKVQGKDKTSIDLKTDEVAFQAWNDTKGLELKYKFKGCVKEKR